MYQKSWRGLECSGRCSYWVSEHVLPTLLLFRSCHARFLTDVAGALDGELERHCLFRATESQLIPTTFTEPPPQFQSCAFDYYKFICTSKASRQAVFQSEIEFPLFCNQSMSHFFSNMVLLIARKHNQPRSQSTDEEVRKMWYVYAMKFYAAAKIKPEIQVNG